MNFVKAVGVLCSGLLVSALNASAQSTIAIMKFSFRGYAYSTNSTGGIDATPITEQTLLADRAAAGGRDPNSLSIVYHLQGNASWGDTVEIYDNATRTKVATEFGFFFGADPSLGRSSVSNAPPTTEIRSVEQLFTLENSTYTTYNNHGMGAVFLTRRFIRDEFGNTRFTAEGPMHWTVNPQGAKSGKICSGTFTTTTPF